MPASAIPAQRSEVPESHLSPTCLSLGDSGLPLWGNRNISFGAGMCYGHAEWLKRNNRAELSGYFCL